MTKRILALMLALCFVFAFAACKKDGGDNGTTTEAGTLANGETVANDETNSDTEAASGDATAVSGDAATEAATDASGKPVVAPTQGSSNQGGGTVAASKPSTKAEIVAYFNTAINKVKPNAKSVHMVSSTNSLAGKITGVPSGINGIFKLVGGIDKFVDDQLKSNSSGATTLTGADIKKSFPVENQSWSSKLTDSDVKSATCTEANGVYTITIVTVADKPSSTITVGSGHNPKAFSVVLPSVINSQFESGVLATVAKTFKIGTAQMEYPSSTITVKVDAKSGNVKSATYDMKWTIHLPLDENMVVLPFATKTIYDSITY